jgi:hypothetical protein
MKYELTKEQHANVIQLLDLALKSGGLQNLKAVNELIVVFNSPIKEKDGDKDKK